MSPEELKAFQDDALSGARGVVWGLIFTAALLFACLAVAKAEVLELRVVRLLPSKLTERDARQVVREASKLLAPTGVTLRVLSWATWPGEGEPATTTVGLSHYARIYGPLDTTQPVTVVLADRPKPFFGVAGLADVCSPRGGRVLLAEKPWKGLGKQKRLLPLVVIFAHELGHILGAQHRPGEHIMNPAPVNVAMFTRWKLGWAPESLAEIAACRGRWETLKGEVLQ